VPSASVCVVSRLRRAMSSRGFVSAETALSPASFTTRTRRGVNTLAGVFGSSEPAG
jgi:hypothetical protein